MLSYDVAQSIADPALTHRWLVYIEGINWLECVPETVEPTFKKSSPKSRFTAGGHKYYPDFSDIDPITLAFYEDHNFTVTKKIQEWRGLVVKSNGKYGVPSEYKRNLHVYLLAHESDDPKLQLQYTGVWPFDPTPFQLSYEDPNARLQVTVQFSVDGLEIS